MSSSCLVAVRGKESFFSLHLLYEDFTWVTTKFCESKLFFHILPLLVSYFHYLFNETKRARRGYRLNGWGAGHCFMVYRIQLVKHDLSGLCFYFIVLKLNLSCVIFRSNSHLLSFFGLAKESSIKFAGIVDSYDLVC